MSLSSEEKRALRQKQKLLFSSGQFPLAGGDAARRRALRKRHSPLKILGLGFAAFLVLVVALVLLITKAARADEGATGKDVAAPAEPTSSAAPSAEDAATPKKIDVEIEVRGERPGPSVVFVDGGRELLRKRMRALSLEAGRENASLGVVPPRPKGPPATVRVLLVSVKDGLLSPKDARRAVVRARESLGACWAGVPRAGQVRAEVTLGAVGVPERARVLVDKTGADPGAHACVVQALAAARWPSPATSDTGTARATVRVDLKVAPSRRRSR